MMCCYLNVQFQGQRVNIEVTSLLWRNSPQWARVSSFSRLHDHTQLKHDTLGRTPQDRWSARRTALYLTTHNTHRRQTSMPPAGFEPAIPASERLQTHALDRAATGIGQRWIQGFRRIGSIDTAFSLRNHLHLIYFNLSVNHRRIFRAFGSPCRLLCLKLCYELSINLTTTCVNVKRRVR